MPTPDISPESAARWQAWIAKGRERDERRNQRIKILVVAVASVGALVASIAFAFR